MFNYSRTWREKTNAVDMRIIHIYECYRLGIYVMPSKLKHPDAIIGMFLIRLVDTRNNIGYYYGKLVYK